MSCETIVKVLLLDNDTMRTWYRLYEEDGIEGLASFGYEGNACRLSEEKQAAFIKAYEDLLNRQDADDVVLFADAVAQTSGRQRLNIHGAIDLESGYTRILKVATVDAASTIQLMIALLAMYPRKRVIHLFVDNDGYHHAKLMQAWLARPGCRIKLHFIPTCCPHPWSASRPKPIERLWGLIHKHVTHNKCHETFRDVSDAILTFLREEVPRNWRLYCDEVTDNFRIISPKDFRILACSGV